MPRSDLSSLSPSDGQVALRSLPRRYGEAFTGDERRARAEIVGPNGLSALDLLENTVGALSLLERALDLIHHADDPSLHAGVLDAAEREFSTPGASVDGMLDQLDHAATSFAERVGAVSADAWSRTGTVVVGANGTAGGGHQVTALGVLQEAVATATDNLRAVGRLLSD